MGEHDIRHSADEAEERSFRRALLEEAEAFALLWENDGFESGVALAGVEQEMFLVDAEGQPRDAALEMLRRLADPRFTTELASFNLEANLPPRPVDGDLFDGLHHDLSELIERVRQAGAPIDVAPLLVGILPTLTSEHLTLAHMTPLPRYRRMNDALVALRGSSFDVRIDGLDPIALSRSDLMMESATTSLQLHLQVDPARFASAYNRAQAITPVLLAAAGCSPLLLGHRLWKETRVALFEQSVDTRSAGITRRGRPNRASFGCRWVTNSPMELFREDIATQPVVLTRSTEPDPLLRTRGGERVPLHALALHNGTVWRWNRPCFGISADRAHVRIENRVLPAGPTVADEVANAALFYGLMYAPDARLEAVHCHMPFEEARRSFFAAARDGLDAHIVWLNGQAGPARDLLLERVLPLARDGLSELGMPATQASLWLSIIEERVRSGRTGSTWMLRGLEGAASPRCREARLTCLTRDLLSAQRHGTPVHTWPDPKPQRTAPCTVADVMSTDLLTVGPDDIADLPPQLMRWRGVHHLPVEDRHGRPVGMVTARRLGLQDQRQASLVADLLEPSGPEVPPCTTIRAAVALMLEQQADHLLVVEDGSLVGLVTQLDLLRGLGAPLAESIPRPPWVPHSSPVGEVTDPGRGPSSESRADVHLEDQPSPRGDQPPSMARWAGASAGSERGDRGS